MEKKQKKPINVLIVEDDPLCKDVLRDMLGEVGEKTFEVSCASMLDEAFSILHMRAFDVVLLDLNLPDAKHFEALDRIRKRFPSIAIIVITGEFDESYGLDIIRRGAQDYLLKGKYDVYTLKKAVYYSLERKRTEEDKIELEKELHQAQKLESIGTLAAGIAHEINTPIQFIANNTRFLGKGMRRLLDVIARYRELLSECEAGEKTMRARERACEIEQKARLEYVEEEIKKALAQCEEGVESVSNIVSAMKDFSHMGSAEMSEEDINKAIESTLTITRNEWKYAANVKSELDPELPYVMCVIGEIKQALLNLIINAAHAIKEVIKEGEKGTITIKTFFREHAIYISIADTGAGIPEGIQDKIFDHFFTTKGVGKGTGQGLTIAYQTIVEKHRGKITFETKQGKGTTFYIELPIAQMKENGTAEGA